MSKPKSRGNGQGTAYKRKNSQFWTAEVVVGWRTPDDENKPPVAIKRSKSGFSSKRDALAYCPTLLSGGIDPKKEAPRLFEYWDTYKTGNFTKLSKSKQVAYRIAWNKLKPLHDIRIDRITVGMMQDAISNACKTFDPAKDCKSVLANLFVIAAKEKQADKDLPSLITLPEHDEKETVPFTDIEQASLWKMYESGDKNAAIPLLMIYTGMMPGEAQKLTVSQIDLERRIIEHAGIKTKVRRKTPIVLSNTIVPVVEDLVANARPNGFIWKHNEEEWYRNYYAALESAGCRRLTPYSCRHTTATALAITEGIAPQTIKRVMRWSTTKMLDRYVHPQTSDALGAVDTLKK